MLLFLIYGWLFGFPGERVKLSKEVKRYVEENYRLTPTDIQISFSIDGMDGASVTTKEWPFTFDVFIHRDKKKAWSDLYLESLTEYYLRGFVAEKLSSLIDADDIRVVLETRFSKNNSTITVKEINDNPLILLDNPNISYFCSIDDVKIGTERSYLIFNQIIRFFNPTSIYFRYFENDGKEKSVCIREEDFNKIKNKEDMMSVIK